MVVTHGKIDQKDQISLLHYDQVKEAKVNAKIVINEKNENRVTNLYLSETEY